MIELVEKISLGRAAQTSMAGQNVVSAVTN